MRRLLLSLLVLAFTLPALAQAKHPFTFDDMMKLKRVGDPQVSPDGKWVIFSVVDVDLEANTKTPHIWIVPTGQVGAPVQEQKPRDHRRSGCRPPALGARRRSGSRFYRTRKVGRRCGLRNSMPPRAQSLFREELRPWLPRRMVNSGRRTASTYSSPRTSIRHATIRPKQKRIATNINSRRPNSRKSRRDF